MAKSAYGRRQPHLVNCFVTADWQLYQLCSCSCIVSALQCFFFKVSVFVFFSKCLLVFFMLLSFLKMSVFFSFFFFLKKVNVSLITECGHCGLPLSALHAGSWGDGCFGGPLLKAQRGFLLSVAVANWDSHMLMLKHFMRLQAGVVERGWQGGWVEVSENSTRQASTEEWIRKQTPGYLHMFLSFLHIDIYFHKSLSL